MPTDDERARRRAFREFVRTAHPDVGGDPDTFAAGLAAFGRSPARTAAPGVRFAARRRPLRSVVRRLIAVRRTLGPTARRRRRNTRVS